MYREKYIYREQEREIEIYKRNESESLIQKEIKNYKDILQEYGKKRLYKDREGRKEKR